MGDQDHPQDGFNLMWRSHTSKIVSFKTELGDPRKINYDLDMWLTSWRLVSSFFNPNWILEVLSLTKPPSSIGVEK